MGFDVAYHAIKAEHLFKEIIPYCLGEKEDINDLIAEIARIGRNRYIANHFAGIVLSKSGSKPENFFKKFIAKFISPKQKEFNSDLYAWGRPFLVLEEEPSKVIDVIKKYCSAKNDSEVLSIIKSQVNLVSPNFYKHNLSEGMTYADSVPKEEYYIDQMKYVSEFKKIVQMSLNGEKEYIDEDNQRHKIKDVLSGFPFQFIEFLSFGCAAWMDRGLINPTSLIIDVGLQIPNYIEPVSTLLGDLKKKLRIHNNERSISGNYSLGGVVFPENIKEFIDFFNKHHEQFNGLLIDTYSYEKEDADLVLQKITEALAYCMHMNMIFVESTDIFSGPEGIMS